MFKTKNSSVLTFTFSLLGVLAATGAVAAPVVIPDTYVGGNVSGYGDVVANAGQAHLFDIHSVEMELSGTLLTVKVNTAFATLGVGIYPNLTQGNTGVGFGDLFLASAWTPYTSAGSTAANGYKLDNATNGTDWEYGFALDNRLAAGGTGQWFDLTGDVQNSAVLTSNDFMSGGTWRKHQAVAVDTSHNAVAAIADNVTQWAVDALANQIIFTMDIAGSTLELSSHIAFHWTMACGNDVIEGLFEKPAVPAPEPGTMALFALSLLGLSRARRRSR